MAIKNGFTLGGNNVCCDATADNGTARTKSVRLVRSRSDNETLFDDDLLSSSALSLTLHARGPDRFFVDNIDISERFYNLQNNVFNFVVDNTLTLESDVPLILSLSSILLLQNNNRLHKNMIPFFGNKIYQKVRQSILESLNMTCTFPGENMLAVIQISQSVYSKTTSRISAAASLLGLAEMVDDRLDKKLIVSASQLVQWLLGETVHRKIFQRNSRFCPWNQRILTYLKPGSLHDIFYMQSNLYLTMMSETYGWICLLLNVLIPKTEK
ncbi:hypothetical protein INT47_009424 [Mucor saturninus]|uniref:Uncharacterized protein n=1 Tax=Mucor saturninus TaxID=64648 RepID=A0A8H7QW32_9FUNG|nr:hypothetical protein INT47_009424 [Mucor saturninus]